MKKILICLCAFLTAGLAQGQSTVNSTGNSTVISGNTYSYSIGEMVLVNTASASNLVVTQGVLQGTGSTVGIKTVQLTENEFKVYPNPTRDVLNMMANIQAEVNLEIKLYDIAGKELISKEWKTSTSNEKKQLSLQAFSVGYYVLNVQYKKGNKVVNQSYKIQKLN